MSRPAGTCGQSLWPCYTVYWDEIAALIEEMEHDAASYTSQTLVSESESGSSHMRFDIDKSMDLDVTGFESETDLAWVSEISLLL